jgi:hypothetical protein
VKLYIIVDAALSPGQQVAQATHAAFCLSQAYPAAIGAWYRKSNYLVVLASNNLSADAERLESHFLTTAIRVHEPDLPGNPLVALAILPSEHVERLVSELPLALKGGASSPNPQLDRRARGRVPA